MKMLITDDHPLVRKGLTIIIREAYPHDEILEAGNGEEAMAILKVQAIDLLLMDIRMPKTDSQALVQQASALVPNMKILVISTNPEHIFALRYLKAGANGYFQKNGDSTELLKAIRTVLSGKLYISDVVTDQMTKSMIGGNTKDNPFDSLTNREFEIVNHLAIGLKPSQICEVMSLEPSTITSYKKKIFDKLGIANEYELYVLAREHNF